MNFPSNNKGFSIAEAVISAAIFMMIGGGLLTTFVAGNRSWGTYTNAVNVQREIRKSMDKMTRDLRVAENISLTQDPDNVNLSFTHPSLGNIIYSWTTDVSSANANRIVRQVGVQSFTVASNISALVITDSANDITIDITSVGAVNYGSGSSLQLVKKVAKR